MACTGTRKIKNCITLNDKLEILKMHDSMSGNVKLNELAKILKISKSTLVAIINNRESIEGTPEADLHRYRTRNKRSNPNAGKSKYQMLEKALAEWVEEIRKRSRTLNGVVLRKQAMKLAAEMGLENFTASNGWSDRFKKKYEIEYKVKPCYCKYKEQEIPEKTNYGVENFLDKVVEQMRYCRHDKTAEFRGEKTLIEKKPKVSLIELKLVQWLEEAKNELNLTKISGSLIQEMALSLAGVMGVTNFTASSGWLNRFKKKHQLLKYKKCKNCRNNLKDTNTSKTENNSEKITKKSLEANIEIDVNKELNKNEKL